MVSVWLIFNWMKKDVLYPVHGNKTGWGKILIFRYYISSKDGLFIFYKDKLVTKGMFKELNFVFLVT